MKGEIKENEHKMEIKHNKCRKRQINMGVTVKESEAGILQFTIVKKIKEETTKKYEKDF